MLFLLLALIFLDMLYNLGQWKWRKASFTQDQPKAKRFAKRGHFILCGRLDTELGGGMVDISLGGTACFEASGYGVVLLLTDVLFKCKLGEERGEPSELLGDVGGVVFESPAAGDVGDVVFESTGGESNWTDDLNMLSWASWSSSAHATPFSL